MPTKILPLNEWLPDRADLGNLVTTATNVLPWVEGYKSFPSFSVVSSNGLGARFQGGTFVRDSNANVYVFAGDATKLYRLDGATFSDVSRLAGGAYNVAVDDWWEFILFGDRVIGVNGWSDAPQTFQIGTSTNFSALSGSPPMARHIAVVRDFVVLGNTDDGVDAIPHRVRWSGINNAISWTVSASTQADYQDLDAEAGWVQKIIGGEYGLVFQERAITRMTYVGSPVIFQFDQVERARGAFAAQGVVAWGKNVFFLADDGFFQIIGDSPAIPIGDGKVDKFFQSDYQSGYAHRITATIDPVNKMVMWSYPGAGSSSGLPNHVLIYNWVYKKWAFAEVETEGFVRYAAVGYTLEGLDAVSASIDALPSSLDSRVWTGGAQALAGFSSAHKVGTFSGTALAATVDTGEYQLTPGRTSYVNFIRPLVDGAAATVAVGARDTQVAAESFSTAIAQNANGLCASRSHAKYHRFRTTTSGAFNFIQGVEVEFEPGGVRRA